MAVPVIESPIVKAGASTEGYWCNHGFSFSTGLLAMVLSRGRIILYRDGFLGAINRTGLSRVTFAVKVEWLRVRG